MTPAGRDVSFAHPISLGRLASRYALLLRLARGGEDLAWALAHSAAMDEHAERLENSQEKRAWFRRWWGAGPPG